MSVKILICGDVEGRFTQLFSRVAAVHKKNGPFEMLFCVGDFFGGSKDAFEPYLNGSLKVPIQTFILGPSKPEQAGFYPNENGSELCTNLTYLGKKGVFAASSGLRLVYLSGLDGTLTAVDQATFDGRDVEDLRAPLILEKDFKGVDILLTSCWPRDVARYAGRPEGMSEDLSDRGSLLVAQLAATVKPRYHFCGSEDIHYERLPYRNHRVLAEGPRHTSRFIALAKLGNMAKKKWLYAFTIVPLDKMEHSELVKQPPDVTECPYQFDASSLEPGFSEADAPQQYFYDMRASEDGRQRNHGQKRGRQDRPVRQPYNKRPKTQLPPLASCWFCLSGTQVEKHLVVSVGDHNYLALPKGGLVSDHLLILPIGHCQATVGLDEEALREMESFKVALCKFYKSLRKTVVFFERNYKSQHLQIQVVPIPMEKAAKIKQVFLAVADSQNVVLDEVPSHSNLSQIVNRGAPYFYVELASGEKLLHRIRGHFPIQFGREVLASPALLNLPEKVDWRTCVLGKERETSLASEFRKAFEPFDFTI